MHWIRKHRKSSSESGAGYAMKIFAIVLAAGKSSRMGSNKLLLQLNNKLIIEHILEKLTNFETVVVTGYLSEEITNIVKRYGAKTVYNHEYEDGMITSFQAGLKVTPNDVDAVFLVLGDTFGFKKSLLDVMVQKMESSRTLLVSPIFEGKRGHPVLVDRKLFPEFLSTKEGYTIKDIILRHEDNHAYIDGDIWTRIDLDTPEDYNYVKKQWDKRFKN
jgi:molybdenum cofactor cytidylyltransferase